MSDIEIARSIKMENISEIAKKINLLEDNIEMYGKYKAKVNSNELEENLNTDKKLILVTAISPTPLGEGKTTVSIAIADALKKIGKETILVLREPSLGPVFGLKGGATGGGYSQVVPMEDINLHFTGDMHAITSANNLLSSMIDNHIYFGNELKIEKVVWKRCLDLNDRALRKIKIGYMPQDSEIRDESFDITAASEIMAILCLSKDIKDLERRIGNIIIGYTKEEKPIFAKDINAQGPMTVLLKDAIKPNLVQTLEHTPVLIHGGPFANIAHGCNSVIATKTAMKIAEYTVTEAGFGADLGAEKFLNIKCRENNIKPNVVVIVATIKALKYHGGMEKEELNEENMQLLKEGMSNLYKHIDNIKNKFGLNTIVALNHYSQDRDNEIKFVKNELEKQNIEFSIVDGWEKGSEGAIDIANKIIDISKIDTNINYTYNNEDTIKEKICKVAKNIYGATDVEYSKEALEKIDKAEKLGYGKFPICIAKTQYSFSDNPENIVLNSEYAIHVQDIEIKAGAEFIVVLTGKVMTMPGLPKKPAAENIKIDDNGEIEGIF